MRTAGMFSPLASKATPRNSRIDLSGGLGGIPDASGTTYSGFMIDENPIRTRYQAVRPLLDERGRRLHAAAEAVTAGRGGVAAASRATKVARSTIRRGLKDLRAPASLTGQIRRKGARRPTATVKGPTLLEHLRQLLEPATMSDTTRPLRWASR